jgi:hypothetical protein
MRFTKVLLPLLAAPLFTAACAQADGPGDRSPDASAAVSIGGGRWLAVAEVAPFADDLSELTEQLRDPLGRALVVSPVDCFEGLPPELEAGYLIGAVGDSAGEVERIMADAGEQVMFTAPVTIVCTD